MRIRLLCRCRTPCFPTSRRILWVACYYLIPKVEVVRSAHSSGPALQSAFELLLTSDVQSLMESQSWTTQCGMLGLPSQRPIYRLSPEPKGKLRQWLMSGCMPGDPWGFLPWSLAGPLAPVLPAFQSWLLKVWSVDPQHSITLELVGNLESWIIIFILMGEPGDLYAH